MIIGCLIWWISRCG